MIIQTSRNLLAYLDAVKNDLPNTTILRDDWYAETKEYLSNIELNVEHAKITAVKQVTGEWKSGEKKQLYQQLINDYRKAQSLAKEISLVKKSLREEDTDDEAISFGAPVPGLDEDAGYSYGDDIINNSDNKEDMEDLRNASGD